MPPSKPSELLATVEQAFAEWAHRFVLRQHAPVDVGLPGAPELVCTNHWRPRVRTWPCGEFVRETKRWDARRNPSSAGSV